MNRDRITGVHVAASFGDRLRGLMGRSRWPKGWAAILFPDCRSVHTAFTFLRPDIVFMDKTNKILRVEAQAAPWKAYWGPTGTRHCLEVPRGTARSRGWKPGKTRLTIKPIP